MSDEKPKVGGPWWPLLTDEQRAGLSAEFPTMTGFRLGDGKMSLECDDCGGSLEDGVLYLSSAEGLMAMVCLDRVACAQAKAKQTAEWEVTARARVTAIKVAKGGA